MRTSLCRRGPCTRHPSWGAPLGARLCNPDSASDRQADASPQPVATLRERSPARGSPPREIWPRFATDHKTSPSTPIPGGSGSARVSRAIWTARRRPTEAPPCSRSTYLPLATTKPRHERWLAVAPGDHPEFVLHTSPIKPCHPRAPAGPTVHAASTGLSQSNLRRVRCTRVGTRSGAEAADPGAVD